MVDLEKCSVDDFLNNKDEYLKYLESYSAWDKVPLLNHDPVYFPDKTLVRFRGMIQDMYNPEIYLESYEVCDKNGGKRILNGKYQDMNHCSENEQVDIESEKTVNGERQTLFVISTPGLNKWVCEEERRSNRVIHKGLHGNSVSCSSQSTKRTSEEDTGNCEDTKKIVTLPEIAEDASKKKENMDDVLGDTCDFSKNCSLVDHTLRKEENEPNSDVNNIDKINPLESVSLEYILNFPIPNKESKACIVKIYDNFDTLKVNEIVDVIGFLSTDPRLVSIGDDEICENQANNLPPSVVPRLHAVCVKQVVHCNPLLDRTQKVFGNNVLKDPYGKSFGDIHRVLTHVLFGDELAAEYTILHLLSRVFSRRDITPIGSYCLNITNVPSESKMKNVKVFIEHLYNVLSSVIPASHLITLTIDELNSAMFVPKKDYNTDRLVSGQLQLPAGTNLFVNEINLEEGKLNQAGVVNLQALRTMIRDQSLKYDFRYYVVDYECDIPVLVLSEGKSILEIPNQVPLEIDEDIRDNFEDIMPAILKFMTDDVIDNIRCYLTCMKYTEFTVEDNLLETIQNDFVILLREPGVTPEDLHSYLTLARLYSLSRGLRILTMENWEAVKTLEQRRRARLTPKKDTVEM